MFKYIVLIGLFIFGGAQAQTISSAFGIRTVYSVTNVTTSAWVQLVASTSSGIGVVSIFDSCGQTLELGVGAAGFEVMQIIIPPGGGGFPLGIPPNSRVSIRALSGNCASANTEDDINFFYN